MKIHERHALQAKAHLDISQAVTAAVAKNTDLTHAELTGILASILLQWNRWAIKDEREEIKVTTSTAFCTCGSTHRDTHEGNCALRRRTNV